MNDPHSPDEPLLTQDELAFIRDVLDTPQWGLHLSGASLGQESSRALTLLKGLADCGKLTLEAQLPDRALTFSVHVSEREADTLHLTIDAPRILQKGPTLRPWRLELDEPLPLLEANGTEMGLHVRELSPNGALVEATRGGLMPEHFEGQLPLPGQPTMRVKGRWVRTTPAGRGAYRLKLSEVDEQHLRQFVFERLPMSATDRNLTEEGPNQE
ncbi:PilZ domain-containing protein [Pseudomonas sp. Marseille-QA0892]